MIFGEQPFGQKNTFAGPLENKTALWRQLCPAKTAWTNIKKRVVEIWRCNDAN